MLHCSQKRWYIVDQAPCSDNAMFVGHKIKHVGSRGCFLHYTEFSKQHITKADTMFDESGPMIWYLLWLPSSHLPPLLPCLCLGASSQTSTLLCAPLCWCRSSASSPCWSSSSTPTKSRSSGRRTMTSIAVAPTAQVGDKSLDTYFQYFLTQNIFDGLDSPMQCWVILAGLLIYAVMPVAHFIL